MRCVAHALALFSVVALVGCLWPTVTHIGIISFDDLIQLLAEETSEIKQAGPHASRCATLRPADNCPC